MKRILVLAKAFPPDLGGVETYSEQIALAYRRLGYRVLAVSQFAGTPGVSRRSGICVINVGSSNQLFVAVKILLALRALLRKRQFAFAHATTWRVALPLTLFKRRPPLYLTLHGNEIARPGWWLQAVMRLVFRMAERIVTISNFSRDLCRRIVPDAEPKTVVSWNGTTYREIATAYIPAKCEVACEVLTCCRLERGKNVDGVIRAVHLLRDRDCLVRLTIAGDGPQRSQLELLVSELGLQDQVQFLGHVPARDLPELYAKSHLFVHPHQQPESFCLVAVDAMSFGVPVVLGRAGAPSEYIEHNRTGMLVDGQNIQEIADIVENLVIDRSLRERISKNAREWSLRTLSWDAHIDKLLKFSAPQNPASNLYERA